MKRIKYRTAFPDCEKRLCFVPFSGNGVYICRLYELGQCKGTEDDHKGKKETKQ